MALRICPICHTGAMEEFESAFACNNVECNYYEVKPNLSIKPHGIETKTAQKRTKTKKPNKYQRECKKRVIDVYDVLTMFNVTNPATQHAIKKLLMPGQRGAKDTIQDLKEALFSIERAIELESDML